MTRQVDAVLRKPTESEIVERLCEDDPLDMWRTTAVIETRRAENTDDDNGRLWRFNQNLRHADAYRARIRAGKGVVPSQYLSPKKYRELMQRANGRCEMCGVERLGTGVNGLHIDHCHRTGYIRGVLCPRCNKALAYVEDLGWLEKALEYLNHHGSLTSENDG